MKTGRPSNRHQSPRFLCLPKKPGESWPIGKILPLPENKVRHLHQVLRMEEGDSLRVIDGFGGLYEGTLKGKGSTQMVQIVSQFRVVDKPSELELAICFAKNSTMDLIMEKATECGATKIIPVVSTHSVVQPKNDIGKYLDRWNTISESALEQSEQAWKPVIQPPLAWKDFLQLSSKEHPPEKIRFAFISEGRDLESLSFETSLRLLDQCFGKAVTILVGPEGGLTSGEREDLEKTRFQPLSFGRHVLRVETAVIAGLTLVKAAQVAGCFVPKG